MFMFMDKNFSEMGHLKAVGFLIFYVPGCFFGEDNAEGDPGLRNCASSKWNPQGIWLFSGTGLVRRQLENLYAS